MGTKALSFYDTKSFNSRLTAFSWYRAVNCPADVDIGAVVWASVRMPREMRDGPDVICSRRRRRLEDDDDEGVLRFSGGEELRRDEKTLSQPLP